MFCTPKVFLKGLLLGDIAELITICREHCMELGKLTSWLISPRVKYEIYKSCRFVLAVQRTKGVVM